jgi:hypothetical protein
MAKNILKCFGTCMIVAMTSCLLLGGLIQQQTFKMWSFISQENDFNCITNGHTCSFKPLEMIGRLVLKLSNYSVHMLLCVWFQKICIDSQVRNWWLPQASYILSISWTFLLKTLSTVT